MKPIKLRIVTPRSDLIDTAPVASAKKHIPKWWHDLPNPVKDKFKTAKNMKYCAGFNDYFNKGFMLPAWSDFVLDVAGKDQDNKELIIGDPTANEIASVIHPQIQRGSYLPEEDWQHVKLSPPWRVMCDEPIQFMLTNTAWNQNDPSQTVIPNGVIEFFWQYSINVNMLIKRPETGRKVIEYQLGEPLVHLIPLTERPVELELELVSYDEFRQIEEKRRPVNMWHAGYYRLKKLCPYSGK